MREIWLWPALTATAAALALILLIRALFALQAN